MIAAIEHVLAASREQGHCYLTEKQIIKSENYVVKPLTIEEAAMQLGTLEQEFIVFRNAETNEINVLYKKRDGNYGWIEPK